MKNKLNMLRERLLASKLYNGAPRPIRWIIRSLSHNLGLKLLSLLLAILLWNYVITTNTSITRPKTVYNLTGYITGLSVLNERQLALIEDPSAQLTGISVTVEAPQANYSRVSAGNIQVSLDLSNVRGAGLQEVPLRATSIYGTVRSVLPESLTLEFETLDSRTVAVNSTVTNEREGYWYNVARSNPSVLSVSGAASVVQSIASAHVAVDVSSMTASTITVSPFTLYDSAGQEISQSMLNCSSSSVSVSLDVYPSRDIPISTDAASLVTGTPAPGYVLQSVTVQPESIQVAAEQDLLDSLTELMIEPVSIDGANQSFSARTMVSQLSNFKNVSSEQVYVNVNISEELVDAYIENVKMLFTGKAENLVASYDPIAVYVSGPRSVVEALQEHGMVVTVDLTGLEEGYHLLDPTLDRERYPDLTIQSEAASITLRRILPEDLEQSEADGAETEPDTADGADQADSAGEAEEREDPAASESEYAETRERDAGSE